MYKVEDWKHLAEIVALLAAAAFFVYKLLAGYLFPNLSLELSSCREPIGITGKDALVVTVTLSKGDRGSIRLHDGLVTIKHESPPHMVNERLLGFHRLTSIPTSLGIIQRREIVPDTLSRSAPLLRLTPGDKIIMAAHSQVPSTEICVVEVTLLGKRDGSRKFGQWRGSLISLPKRP